MRGWARSRNCLLKSWRRPGSAFRSCSHYGPPLGRSASRPVRLATRELFADGKRRFRHNLRIRDVARVGFPQGSFGSPRYNCNARPTSPRPVTPQPSAAQAPKGKPLRANEFTRWHTLPEADSPTSWSVRGLWPQTERRTPWPAACERVLSQTAARWAGSGFFGVPFKAARSCTSGSVRISLAKLPGSKLD
jgi:hypothetical protein